MGLFDSLKKVAGPIIGAVTGNPAVGAAISGGLGLLGSERANSATAASTQAQMDFQERMRNTSYQSAVADMRLAGINPRLAYSQGGAAVPAGASYSARDVSQSAVPAYLASVQARNLVEQNNNLKSQQLLNTASARSADASATASNATASKNIADAATILARLPANKALAANSAKEANSFFARVVRPRTKPFADAFGDFTGAIGNVFRGSQSTSTHFKGE
nr:MAG: DNA pilot protein [Microvirus sp.]